MYTTHLLTQLLGLYSCNLLNDNEMFSFPLALLGAQHEASCFSDHMSQVHHGLD